MSENEINDLDGVLNEVIGGEPGTADHSQENVSETEKSLEADKPAPPETKEVFDPYGEDENSFVEDSGRDEGEKDKVESEPPVKGDSPPENKDNAPDAEMAALRKELANYEKRLHDTQKAMHEAKAERAAMQKELEELRKKPSDGKEGDDDWFGNDKSPQSADVEEKIKGLEQQQEQIQQDMLKQQWLNDASSFAATHTDFNELVYKKLEPLLDEQTGDPRIRAIYLTQEDRSPAAAYEFARKLPGLLAVLDGKQEVPESKEQVAEPESSDTPVRGKDGLDRFASADFPESRPKVGNLVDEVFG